MKLGGQLLTFIVLLFGLRLLLYKPVLKMLDERQERIAQGLKDAREAGIAREEAQAKALETLRDAARRAEEVIDTATKAAAALRADMAAQTQLELQHLREQQALQLEAAQVAMLREVRQEVVSLVVATTEKVLRQHLSDEDQHTVTALAAKELH